jgi:hypothetical protein
MSHATDTIPDCLLHAADWYDYAIVLHDPDGEDSLRAQSANLLWCHRWVERDSRSHSLSIWEHVGRTWVLVPRKEQEP